MADEPTKTEVQEALQAAQQAFEEKARREYNAKAKEFQEKLQGEERSKPLPTSQVSSLRSRLDALAPAAPLAAPRDGIDHGRRNRQYTQDYHTTQTTHAVQSSRSHFGSALNPPSATHNFIHTDGEDDSYHDAMDESFGNAYPEDYGEEWNDHEEAWLEEEYDYNPRGPPRDDGPPDPEDPDDPDGKDNSRKGKQDK